MWLGGEAKDGIKLVFEWTAPAHGGYRFTYMFEREEDMTRWAVSGVCTNGGDYHSFRDEPAGHTHVSRVMPNMRKPHATTGWKKEDE